MASKIFVGFILSVFGLILLFSIDDKSFADKRGSFVAVTVEVEESTSTSRAVAGVLRSYMGYLPVAKIIEKIVIEADRRPYKFQTEVYLKERIKKSSLIKIAKIIKVAVGGGYERVFISFRVPEVLSNWATAHYEPEMKVLISGMTVLQFEKASDIKQVPPVLKEEKLISQALYVGIGGARRVQIVKKKKAYVARVSWPPSLKATDHMLIKKGNDYWLKNSGFNDFYRVMSDKMEIRDKDGFIRAAKREK